MEGGIALVVCLANNGGGYSAGSNEVETAMANIHIKHHTVSYRVHY